jgi:predicted Zn finger-like uncharacterized protein
MQIACPSCHTAFHLDPTALGNEGRTVRCARCRTSWFARQEDIVVAVAMSGAVVDVEIQGEPPRAEAERDSAVAETPAMVLPQVVPWNDTVMVEVNPAPPIVPETPQVEAAPELRPSTRGKVPFSPSSLVARRVRAKNSPAQRWIALAVVFAGVLIFAAVGSRASIVRVAPDLAGLYAAIGLPVNLRGLEISEIKTMHEVQDGISVLVIEGEVVNIARRAVEVPRLRLAVLGPDERELYSWTSLLSRSVLQEGEKLSFRSRLASPPPDGQQVLVRFLTRFDLTANGR